MWHEARKQEKKIRGLMVDFKRRADRRREFYEKIKLDPTQFLRMYGRPLKVHLDPAVATAAEGPQSMMPWQGDENNMIDRFDVRANLDIIPEYVPEKISIPPSKSEDEDERFANYERYRTLVENEAAGLSEEYSLHQIYMDEHFGVISKGNEEELEKKKRNADKKAAIGFVYEDSTPIEEKKEEESEEEEESDEDIETVDLDVTIDVDTLTPDQSREINLYATQYGMKSDDFVRLLRRDKEEMEALKEARQLEEAKAQFSGRKSRKERRAINEKRQNPLRFSRPSYAARESPKYEPYKRQGSSSRSRSRSRSRTPVKTVKKFITSFGAESDEEAVVQGPALPPNFSSAKIPSPESSKCEASWSASKILPRKSKSKSVSRSRSRSRSRRYRNSSNSSRSYSRSRSRSRVRSRSRSRSHRRRFSRDRRSRGRRSSSRSRSRSRSRSARPKNTQSPEDPVKKLPEIKRYRRDSLSSSSGLSGLESEEEDKSKATALQKLQTSVTKDDVKAPPLSQSGKITSKQPTQSSKLSIKDRLKRRMQAQLSKQYKADKKARISKITQQEQERLDREEEIRTLALDMRRREREKRHKELEEEEREREESLKRRKGDDSDSSRSSSGSRSLSTERRKTPDKKRLRPESRRSEERRRDERKDDRRDSRSSDRRRGFSDERRRSDERKYEGRRREDEDRLSGRFDRDGARWSGDRGSSDRNRRFSSGILPDPRWDGGHYDSRDRGRRYDGRRGEYDERSHWNGRSQSAHNRSRGPLLHRPTSPLMSRPRPPNDPRLMEEFN